MELSQMNNLDSHTVNLRMNERRNFLAGSIAGVIAAACGSEIAQSQETEEAESGIPLVVNGGNGLRVWAMGVLVTVKVKASDTRGAYSAFEDLIPPGAGPVAHVHSKEDETIYVLEGKLRAWLGGKEHDLSTGDFVHMPRGVEHYFKNLTDKPTRLLLTYTPGGFEQWFLDVGTPVNNDETTPPKITPKDIEKAISEARRYGVQFTKR